MTTKDWLQVAALLLGIPTVFIALSNYLLTVRERSKMYRERLYDRQLSAYSAIAEASANLRQALLYAPEAGRSQQPAAKAFEAWWAEWRDNIPPAVQNLDQVVARHTLFVSPEAAAAIEALRREAMNLVFEMHFESDMGLDRLKERMNYLGSLHEDASEAMRLDLSIDALRHEANSLLRH